MMKALDIALKDLLRSIRGPTFLAISFLVPLLVAAIFYFAFGGLASGEGGFDLPTSAVQVVNQDQPLGGFSAGQMLVDVLGSEELADLLQVATAESPEAARAAVDRQEAAVAVLVPQGFTAALFEAESRAAVEVYHDPTLTLAPQIVKSLIQQFVDGFAGSRIAVDVMADQWAESGLTLEASEAEAVALAYGRWSAEMGQAEGDRLLIDVRSPAATEPKSGNVQTDAISLIMAGMMVFFVFFAGAFTAQSLLQEQESGTLPRLFTTPTPRAAVLAGRILASLVTLVIQVGVLLGTSALIFGIDWGSPGGVVLVALGMIILAASLGLFITSLLKNTRQGGVIFGGVLTLAGMVGMMNIFTAGTPGGSPGALGIVPLLVPHGWAVRGWELLLRGGGWADVLPTVLVMLALSAALFAVSVYAFRRRFA